MSNTTTLQTARPDSDAYVILDQLDADQVTRADASIRQALVYDLRGKKQITLMGIKWLVLKMSEHGNALQFAGDPECRLERHGESKDDWRWYATVRVRSAKTGFETLGMSEAPYLTGNGEYDAFGRTKAMSKAERNAYRKQIPELEIQTMLETASGSQVEVVGGVAAPKEFERCVCAQPKIGYKIEDGPAAGHNICVGCQGIIIRGARHN